jgi:hypothetical protein
VINVDEARGQVQDLKAIVSDMGKSLSFAMERLQRLEEALVNALLLT